MLHPKGLNNRLLTHKVIVRWVVRWWKKVEKVILVGKRTMQC
jgi:hypothetical protein